MLFSMPFLYAFLLFVLGVVFGSFGNVLVYRLPRGESVNGWSRCRSCGARLGTRDLVPLFSYAALRGRCRACRERISWQYPLIELAGGFLFLLAGALVPMPFQALLLALALWLLLLIATVDLQTQRIPDALSIPFTLLAVVYSLSTGSFDALSPTIAVGFLGAQWLVSRGKWVGSGDVLLVAGLSALAGPWQQTLLALILSYIIGAVMAAGLLLSGKKQRDDTLSFAPFLASGLLVTLVYGEQLLRYVPYM